MNIRDRISVSIYDKGTGEITGFASIHPNDFNPDEHLSEIYDGKQVYLDLADQQIKPKIDSGITCTETNVLQGTPVTISGIPNPSTLWVQDVGYVLVEDGVLELDTSTALETFTVKFNEVQYLPVTFEIEVSPPA